MSEKKQDQKNLELALEAGELVGQTKAFTRIAGRCTAAKAQALAAIHDKKQYRVLGMGWEEFCQKKVGMNRRLADQHIRDLKEFGTRYFDLAQLTPITAAKYRAIAPSVNSKGLLYKGETIAFTEKDAPRLTAAIAELNKAAENARQKTDDGAEPGDREIEAAERALSEAVDLSYKVAALPLSLAKFSSFGIRLNYAINNLRNVQNSIFKAHYC